MTPSPTATAAAAPVLWLFAEGLRLEDLSRSCAPFLQQIRWNGLLDASLRGAPGEQRWGELFSGAWPERSGALAAWTLDPASGLPFSPALARLAAGLDMAARATGWRRLAGRFFPPRARAAGEPAPPACAPRRMRRALKVSDSPGLYTLPGRAPLPTLFDSILAAGKRAETTAFPTSPREEVRLFSLLGYMSRAFTEPYDLYLAKLPGCDRLFFQQPPGSPERGQILRDLDGLIERLTTRFRRLRPNGVLIVTSAGGAVAARSYFDAAARLLRAAGRHGLIPYRDFALLTHRTFLRAWAFTPAAQEFFRMFAGYDRQLRRYGRILTSSIAHRQRLPTPGSIAGDWLWFARPGVIVFPNDFDIRRPRAAAGYLHLDAASAAAAAAKPLAGEEYAGAPDPGDPLTSDQGFTLVSIPEDHALAGNQFRGELNRVDMCSIAARLLGVRAPAAAQGRSVL